MSLASAGSEPGSNIDNAMLKMTQAHHDLIEALNALIVVERAARRYWTAHRGAVVKLPDGCAAEYDAAHAELTKALEKTFYAQIPESL